MKKIKKTLILSLIALIFCVGGGFKSITTKAATLETKQANTSASIKPMNAVNQYYRSYCFTQKGAACSPAYHDSYWRSDAFSVIWSSSGSWKGFVLNSTGAAVNSSNCAGVVLSTTAGAINVDFDNSYYTLSTGAAPSGCANNYDYVRGVQQALVWLGYNIGNSGVDGDYGYNTEQAVIKFQANHNLTQDGTVGKQTYFELSRATK